MSRRVSHTKTLSVVDEEVPVNEFGQMTAALVTPPRLPVPRRLPGKHLALLRQSTAAGGPGPIPLVGMILPPSPPESPSVFELNVQAARYLACQPRAETPPYSDEDEDPLPEGQMLTAEPLSAANGFFAPLTTSPRPLSPATHELARHAILPPGVASAGLSIRRTSSPPTLEQIARRLRGTAVGGPSAPPRRNSEPPVSPRSTTTSLPALAPVRAETLPSRLPTFLLNRARAQPVPAIASSPTRVVPGRPSSSTTAPGSAVPVRVGSAAVSRPRMVIQEIPTFKLTPPPEREERALALRQRLARGAEERASANILIERRRSTGSSLADALLQASEGGGLRVPGL